MKEITFDKGGFTEFGLLNIEASLQKVCDELGYPNKLLPNRKVIVFKNPLKPKMRLMRRLLRISKSNFGK